MRLNVLLSSLRDMLSGLSRASASSAHSTSLVELIERATQDRPLEAPHARDNDRVVDRDPDGNVINADQKQALLTMLQAAQTLEVALQECTVAHPLPYRATPTPNLRVRPPL